MPDKNLLTRTPDLVYASKGNICHPGTAAEAAASEARAAADLAARYEDQLETTPGDPE